MRACSEYYLQKTTSSSDSDQDHEPTIRLGGFAEFKRRMKSLFTNGVYMCIVLYGIFEAMVVSGFTIFGAKYMQQQFGLKASTAGIVFGQSMLQ